jgi:hypothetical protein
MDQSGLLVDIHNSALVTLVNALHDILAAANCLNPINLPQLAIVGSTCSDKKKWVLKSIIGRDL